VEVINGNLQIADTAAETDAFKLDPGGALEIDDPDAVNALIITDGTNAHEANLPGDHITKTAWHVSDDGRGGKTASNAPASETGDDTSAQSNSADNHFRGAARSPRRQAVTGTTPRLRSSQVWNMTRPLIRE
jgi:hypothetical protein